MYINFLADRETLAKESKKNVKSSKISGELKLQVSFVEVIVH